KYYFAIRLKGCEKAIDMAISDVLRCELDNYIRSAVALASIRISGATERFGYSLRGVFMERQKLHSKSFCCQKRDVLRQTNITHSCCWFVIDDQKALCKYVLGEVDSSDVS